jgi:glycosyltransferase involved in cell wall biosynthesis
MHVPSNPVVKGTVLIAEPMRRVVDQGIVSYEQLRGIASSKMPSVYAQNDVVLDQFRLGSYGVAACEAMAAGCVVVSHVTEFVRSSVEDRVGMELPIIEATPDNLAEVLTALAADAGLRREVAGRGRAFVAAIHSGERSAAVLSEALGSAAQGAR